MKFSGNKFNKFKKRRKLSYNSESDSTDYESSYSDKNKDKELFDIYDNCYYLYGEIRDKPMLKLNKFIKLKKTENKNNMINNFSCLNLTSWFFLIITNNQ